MANINPIFCPFFRTIAFDAFAGLVLLVEKTCWKWCKYFFSKVQSNWNFSKIFLTIIFSTPTPEAILPEWISTPVYKDKNLVILSNSKLMNFSKSTLASRINISLCLLSFWKFSRSYGLKRLEFYYISLHILRGH